ncbi:MAG: fibronectin-binding domain-containing protein [Clostridiaceae bacterium]|nr:fibronectin-binding domain-containing protein [Clostridiaceae bacterium]
MPLDGLTAHFLAEELNRRLKDSRIFRIDQIDRQEIVLSLNPLRGATTELRIGSSGDQPELSLLSERQSGGGNLPRFGQLLRKYMPGGRLYSIRAVNFDRVIKIDFLPADPWGYRPMTLYFEFIGRYINLILVNPEGRIIDALNHIDNTQSRLREVLPARPYQFPPSTGQIMPTEVSLLSEVPLKWADLFAKTAPRARELVAARMNGEPTLSEIVTICLAGCSPFAARGLCHRAGLNGSELYSRLSPTARERFHDSWHRLIFAVQSGQTEPTIYLQSRPPTGQYIPVDFHAFNWPLPQYETQSVADLTTAAAVASEARRSHNIWSARHRRLKKEVDSLIKQVERRLSRYAADLSAAEDFEQDKCYGDLILANLHSIEPGQNSAVVKDYYRDPPVSTEISLAPELSVTANARRYYRSYTRKKNRREILVDFVKAGQVELEWLQNIKTALDNSRNHDDLAAIEEDLRYADQIASEQRRVGQDREPDSPAPRQYPGMAGRRKKNSNKYRLAAKSKKNRPNAEPQSQPLEFTSKDGLTILVGRNNLQNEHLTFHIAHKDDIWLHISRQPGSHVIIRSAGQPVPQSTIVEAAQIAAWYSSARTAATTVGEYGGSVSVDFCPVNRVKKPRGARPGMVNYFDYQTIVVRMEEPVLPEAEPS